MVDTNRADGLVCVESVGWLDLTMVDVIVAVACSQYGSLSTNDKDTVSGVGTGTNCNDRTD